MDAARISTPEARTIPPLSVYLGRHRLTQAVQAGLIERAEGRAMWRGWGDGITVEKVEAVLERRRLHRSSRQQKGRRVEDVSRGRLPGMTDQAIRDLIDQAIASSTPEERADALLWVGHKVQAVDRAPDQGGESTEGILRLPVRQGRRDQAVDGGLDAVSGLLACGELGGGEVVRLHATDCTTTVESMQQAVAKKAHPLYAGMDSPETLMPALSLDLPDLTWSELCDLSYWLAAARRSR